MKIVRKKIKLKVKNQINSQKLISSSPIKLNPCLNFLGILKIIRLKLQKQTFLYQIKNRKFKNKKKILKLFLHSK
jgi:hypothetical protein